MEYAYATCLLSETGAEINEENLKAVLDAAGSPVQESRLKAVVAALENEQVADTIAIERTPQENTTDRAPDSEPTEG